MPPEELVMWLCHCHEARCYTEGETGAIYDARQRLRAAAELVSASIRLPAAAPRGPHWMMRITAVAPLGPHWMMRIGGNGA
jgi:hypothetical protein